MTLKTKCAFDLAAKLPPTDKVTERDLQIMRWTMEYMAQHFVDVVENYDAEKELARHMLPN